MKWLYAAVRTDVDAQVQERMQKYFKFDENSCLFCDPALLKLYINQKSNGN